MYPIKTIWIDSNWDRADNKKLYDILKSKTEYFVLKPFKDLDEGFKTILEIKQPEIIIVIIRGRLYQDYYEKLKNSREKIICRPINIIFTSDRLRKILRRKVLDEKKEIKPETFSSIEDEYYNKGGIAVIYTELLKIIEDLLKIDLQISKESKLFILDEMDKNYENLILPCLYNKAQLRDSIVSDEEIKDFNVKLLTEHRDDSIDSKLVSRMSIMQAIAFWINYFTHENTFYKTMYKQFLENNFSNYKTFIKSLNRGLETKILKSKYNVPLYYCCGLPKDDLETLEQNLKNGKKELIYSRQLLSFTQDINVSFKFLTNKDKNSIPVLFEVNNSKNSEPYATNVDIQNFSFYKDEKEVTFLPYSCFIIEDKIEEIKQGEIKYKKIKLNYLGKYSKQLNGLLANLDSKKIESLFENKSFKFSQDIKKKFRNEFPKLENYDFFKRLNIEAQLIVDKNKQKENYIYPINDFVIKMIRKGKFLGDDYFQNYHWMLDIYFDGELQKEATNEIIGNIPKVITIKIKYPIFDCEKMFYLCENIKEIKFNKFDTSKVKNMNGMFSDCISLIELKLDGFDTKNVTNMSCMFYKCSSLKNLDLSKFKTDNVVDMSAMFYLCSSLKNLNFDLSTKKIDKLKDIRLMFRGASSSLENYDLSNFDISKIEHKDGYI